MSYWEELERPAPDAVTVDGVQVRGRSRVRLRPRPGGDVLDLALAGRTAVVEGIDQDLEGNVRLAVVVEDDPGRDLGVRRQPGHRFFFALAGRLARRSLPAGVEVVDFGIRGMDLALAMQEELDAVVLLDATPRGGRPGTLYVIEPEVDADDVALDAHGMDPVKVLALARTLGGSLPRTLVVGCEPQTRMSADAEEIVAALSEPVRAALDEAVRLVESVLEDLIPEPEAGAP
jgi:hydrogenase maturation protease